MQAKIIEGTNGFNWGKFMLLRFTQEEWSYVSQLGQIPLLRGRGWGPSHVWVLDLETGEGFCTLPGGMARADLKKHEIWVCPMFEPFLEWLYTQDLSDFDKLPSLVDLEGESALRGYRRPGASFEELFSEKLRLKLAAFDLRTMRQLTCLTYKTVAAILKDKGLMREVETVFKKEGFRFAEVRQEGA